MIQIENWVIIAGLLAIFIVGISYLVYFKITRKLFSMEKEFQQEINRDEAISVLSIDGSGIIKKIEMQVTENQNSLISMIIDGTTYTNFIFNRELSKLNQESFKLPRESLLKIEVNFDTKFQKDFSIVIHNRNNASVNSTGRIFYEIKRPLRAVLKAIWEESVS